MISNFREKDRYTFDDLVRIMALLRGEGGCPWDRVQTHESIRRNFIEETYEVLDALDRHDPVLLQEELGDVMMQVVFHAQMEQEAGRFDIGDVADGVCKKLVRRHPHVFGDGRAQTPEEVLNTWDAVKAVEKGQPSAGKKLRAVPRQMPALMRAAKVRSRARKAGLDAEKPEALLEQAAALLGRMRQDTAAGQKPGAETLGALLFALCGLADRLELEPEEALTRACDGFIDRVAPQETGPASSGKKTN